MRTLKLSASSINTFKACPFRFRNAYVLGIRPVEDTDAQRIGTNWHEILEVASLEPGGVCECMHKIGDGPAIITGKIASLDIESANPNCPLCEGTGRLPDDIMDAVIRVLDKAYADVPVLDKQAREIERIKLLYALIGYRWYHNDTISPAIAREEYFSMPLFNPDTGHPVPDVFITGKIDKLVTLASDRLAVKEHKTTGSSLDSDSSYWAHLNMDTQTSLYIYAARRLQLAGMLEKYGTKATDPLISEIEYDVHHKPQISPKMLTQGDSKKFVEDGEYCGQKFKIEVTYMEDPGTRLVACAVNDRVVETENGKKEGTFAIRETPEMYGARLLQDITERPKFYFECRSLVRTDAEMKAFEYELYDIAKDMQYKIRADRWWHNENQCEATFTCDYCDSCYNRIPLDPTNPPAGMKCIFRAERKSNG